MREVQRSLARERENESERAFEKPIGRKMAEGNQVCIEDIKVDEMMKINNYSPEETHDVLLSQWLSLFIA